MIAEESRYYYAIVNDVWLGPYETAGEAFLALGRRQGVVRVTNRRR